MNPILRDSEKTVDFAMDGSISGFASRPRFLGYEIGGVARLLSDEEGPLARGSIDWDAVDGTIQEELAGLTFRILESSPGARWSRGQSRARAFALFSYRTFDRLDGDDFDPIIIGVNCIEEGESIRVEGDISGDETGRIYFDTGCNFACLARQDAVLEATRTVARYLSLQYQIVLSAMKDRAFGTEVG